MKVLWLSPSPAGLSSSLKFNFPGGGWITSLENQIKQQQEIELAVCFFHYEKMQFRIRHEGVIYYPVFTDLFSLRQKISSRLSFQLPDSNVPGILKAIDDFQPDIIQVFGTEYGLGEVAGTTDIPVIIHIQGLLNPIYAAWLPSGYSIDTIRKYSSLKNRILGGGFPFDYRMMAKRAKREENILQNCQHYFGRTAWDKNILGIYKKQFHYYHCDEMLRPEFYHHQWKAKSNKKLRIVTTINESIYKGLEIVLQTAYLLKHKSKLSFEWNILGISEGSQLAGMVAKILGLSFSDQNIRFLGPRTGNDLISELLAADVFVHPSHIDNSPNSICEAQLLGIPVIAGRVGGIPSLIKHNETGILYNSNDPYELASILKEKTADMDFMNKLSRQSAEVASTRHNYDVITNTVLNTYESIIKKEQNNVFIPTS